MAKAVPIKAIIRETSGTRSAHKCRREGMLPAVVYGHQKESVSVAMPAHEFLQNLQHGTHLLELLMPEDKKETVLIREVQYDHLGDTPLHVDLTRVNLSERVTVNVPIVLRGEPAGVAEGGMLTQALADLEIECVVTDIPEEIRVRVNDMNIGDTLHASDLPVPEGITMITDPETAVASVSVVAEEPEEEAEVAEAEAVTGAEPEVIGKGKEEEEGEAAE